MATLKLTLAKGQPTAKVVVSAGSVIAGGNAVELNIDTTTITQSEIGALIDQLSLYVVSNKWPN